MLFSCTSKIKKNEDANISQEAVEIVETAETENNYEAIPSEEAAVVIDEKTEIAIQEVEVQDRVLFEYDSSEISEEAKKILDTQADWLKSDTSITITIEGHCDEKGTREYNIALGEKRAEAAKSYLVSNGVSDSRIKIISYGKERPAFFGVSNNAMAKNRRAVTIVN